MGSFSSGFKEVVTSFTQIGTFRSLKYIDDLDDAEKKKETAGLAGQKQHSKGISTYISLSKKNSRRDPCGRRKKKKT